MKKLFIALCMVAFMAVNVHAEPRTYTLYLGKTDSGNTTTNVSGVSTLIVEASGYKRTDGITDITGLEYLEDGTAMIQVEAIEVSQGAANSVATNSGATFTLR